MARWTQKMLKALNVRKLLEDNLTADYIIQNDDGYYQDSINTVVDEYHKNDPFVKWIKSKEITDIINEFGEDIFQELYRTLKAMAFEEQGIDAENIEKIEEFEDTFEIGDHFSFNHNNDFITVELFNLVREMVAIHQNYTISPKGLHITLRGPRTKIDEGFLDIDPVISPDVISVIKATPANMYPVIRARVIIEKLTA